MAAEGGQQGIWPLLFDNLCHGFRGNRFNVNLVSRIRIRHYGGGVGVDEHHLIPLFLKGLARLCTGIVKFTGLTYDDGACTYNKNFFYVCTFWHFVLYFPIISANWLKRYAASWGPGEASG